MELRNPDWLERMVGLASRKNVGAVGARLFFPDNTIQHAGVIVKAAAAPTTLGTSPSGERPWLLVLIEYEQDLGRDRACLMTRRELFEEMNGLR